MGRSRKAERAARVAGAAATPQRAAAAPSSRRGATRSSGATPAGRTDPAAAPASARPAAAIASAQPAASAPARPAVGVGAGSAAPRPAPRRPARSAGRRLLLTLGIVVTIACIVTMLIGFFASFSSKAWWGKAVEHGTVASIAAGTDSCGSRQRDLATLTSGTKVQVCQASTPTVQKGDDLAYRTDSKGVSRADADVTTPGRGIVSGLLAGVILGILASLVITAGNFVVSRRRR